MKVLIRLNQETYSVDIEAVGPGRYRVSLQDQVRVVDAVQVEDVLLHLLVNGSSFDVGIEDLNRQRLRLHFFDESLEVEVLDPARAASGSAAVASARVVEQVRAPMAGRVVRIYKQVGERVAADEAVLVMEAMKMQNEIRASIPGRITDLRVAEGDTVSAGAILGTIRREEHDATA